MPTNRIKRSQTTEFSIYIFDIIEIIGNFVFEQKVYYGI